MTDTPDGTKPWKPRPNTALIEAAEEADRNMYVFRRGLAIRAARRRAERRGRLCSPEESLESMRCALAQIDSLPASHRPADDDPLKFNLPGMWPTIADLRNVVALAERAVLNSEKPHDRI